MLLIAAGGLHDSDVLFRLPFFLLFGFGGGGGGMSEPDAFQSPSGKVVFRGCSASGASHSELWGEGMSSEESRFWWRKKEMENLRRDLVD